MGKRTLQAPDATQLARTQSKIQLLRNLRKVLRPALLVRPHALLQAITFLRACNQIELAHESSQVRSVMCFRLP